MRRWVVAVQIHDAQELVALSGEQLGNVVAGPLEYIAWTLMYFDLRVRKESFDLDQLAQQLQSTGPSPIG